MKHKMSEEEKYPHSPYIKEREILDHGFSKGWGFHFQPSQEYWLDCHSHLNSGKTHAELNRLLDQWFAQLDGFRLGKVLLIVTDTTAFKVYQDISRQDKRFGWLFWMPFDQPNVEVLQTAMDHGCVGLKLHNFPIMQGMGEPEVWLTDEWRKVFQLAEENGLPVLWHVTQRVSYSPYHGGGANPYWVEGEQRGIKFTNEDLLQVFLEVITLYPKLKFIGAHQLYIGLERLAALLDLHNNLYVDTSCGFYVRWADTLYKKDREILWAFFMKYKDRILFGTDSGVAPDAIDEYLVQGFLCHARFVHQLRLPNDVLQAVAYQNAEYVFGISPIQAVRRGNVRP